MEKLRKMLSVEIEMRSINEYEYFAFDIDRNSSSQENHEDDYSDSSQQHGRESRKPGKRPNGTADMLLAEEGREPSRKQRQCIFCGEGHHSDHCSKYPDVASREARLGSQICFRCLRKGHCTEDCENPSKPCFYCNSTTHHCSLCPIKFSNSTTTAADNYFVSPPPKRPRRPQQMLRVQSKGA